MEVISNHFVDKFIISLDNRERHQVIRTIELLAFNSYRLGMPHSKKITKSLFELRIIGQLQIRIVYTFHKNQIYLLHVFVKKTQKIPQRDLNLSLRRYKHLTQYN